MKETQDNKQPKLLLSALRGATCNGVPFWFMRQAGRYLPEYRQLRGQAGGFLDLVYNPDFATEVTLQPLRRYGMDAAILFSDILVIPHALGQDLKFSAGEGPKLAPVRSLADMAPLHYNPDRLGPVYETVMRVRAAFEKEKLAGTALIGFAGSPWTVATYMVEGGGSKNFEHVKKWAYGDPRSFAQLIDMICEATIHYLSRQVDAGAEALQLFDSWAGALDETNYMRWVIEPTRRITDSLRSRYPDIPLIGFPKGSGSLYNLYADHAGIDALGMDSAVPFAQARALQSRLPVQGNLDPVMLLAGGDALQEAALKILDALSGGPFIFNLGHGVIKETPPEHVAQLAKIIREYRP